ncbi:MAG: DUF4956 domain-containing protein [Vicinamibacterales bacterium]
MHTYGERLTHNAVAWFGALLVTVLVLVTSGAATLDARQQPGGFPDSKVAPGSTEAPKKEEQLLELKHALQRMPLAAVLAAALALRPRRRGTPGRALQVIQTQIILAVIGSLVMLVVGSSLARAFGIVGAAGLVRYRAKVDDPKDAGVMLSTLAVGLASGVGLWMLAIFGTLFILIVLGVLESFEPRPMRKFALRIKVKDPAAFKPKVEEFLTRQHTEFEIREVTPEELNYEVCWPVDKSTDPLSESILAMDPSEDTEVKIEDVKAKK